MSSPVACVYVLIDDEFENHYKVLSAHSSYGRALRERNRLYVARDIEAAIANTVNELASYEPSIYAYLYKNRPPEMVARRRHETIRIVELVVDL